MSGVLDSDGVIRHFAPDISAHCTPFAYTPNTAAINRQIKKWNSESIKFEGFVHSHPQGFDTLSSADREYAARILASFANHHRLALPLAMTEPDSGKFKILPFVAVPDPDDRATVRFLTAALIVERFAKASRRTTRQTSKVRKSASSRQTRSTTLLSPQPISPGPRAVVAQNKIEAGSHDAGITLRYHGNFLSVWRKTAARFVPAQTSTIEASLREQRQELRAAQRARAKAKKHFARVQNAYDLPRLDQTRLIVIGTGGSAELVRDCSRAGFGEFVLIDPDDVSASNVGTQGADPAWIGAPKVEALAYDICAINPVTAVVSLRSKIECIDDAGFEMLAVGAMRGCAAAAPESQPPVSPSLVQATRPTNVLLLVLTDNFEAQARGHRLGLQFGFPTICAQEYHEGRGAEITFTVPGATPACHRCITASRYRAYLSEGYRNTITSHGAPIFAAQMLNAALGHILLAIAHHGTAHPRFGNLVARLGSRNLIFMRMDPDFDAFIGWPAFSRPLAGASDPASFIMLDALFLAQSPDCGQNQTRPVCPDCGGQGDLRLSIGTFHDTRVMRTG
jgi:hypothetical protein